MEAAKVLLEAATAFAAKPDGLVPPVSLPPGVLAKLVGEPLVKHFLETWATAPPVVSGGFYFTRHPELKKKWRIPKKLSAKFRCLWLQINKMLTTGELFPMLHDLELWSLSLLWTNGMGAELHVDDPRSAPYALAVASLGHYTDPKSYELLLQHEPQTSIDVADAMGVDSLRPTLPSYTMQVPEGSVYVLTGAALKHYKHMVVMEEPSENLGKVALRLGFKKKTTDFASELQLYDTHVSVRGAKDRAAAVATATRTSPRLPRQDYSIPKATPAAKRTLQLSTSSSSTSSPSKEDHPHAAYDIDCAKLAAVVSKKSFWMPESVYYASKDEREKLKQDVGEMFQLRFGPDWGDGQASEVLALPEGGVQGELHGGTFWKNKNERLGASRMLWKLCQQFPEAQMNWAHDPECSKYMKKLVFHGDIVGFTTTSLPRLQGRTEKDWSSLRGGPTLTEQRRKLVINIDRKHDGPYMHGNRSKAKKMTGKSETTCKEGAFFKCIIELVRAKLPPHLHKHTKLMYDISVLINGTLSPDHVDELDGDGVGHLIVNIYLWGDGLFIFTEESGNIDLPIMGTYVGPNHYTMFTGGLRYQATHQVLRWQSKPYPLDMLRKTPKEEWRMALTLRFGKSSAKDTDIYNKAFGIQFDRERPA